MAVLLTMCMLWIVVAYLHFWFRIRYENGGSKLCTVLDVLVAIPLLLIALVASLSVDLVNMLRWKKDLSYEEEEEYSFLWNTKAAIRVAKSIYRDFHYVIK